jgi:hypothetical protein
VIAALLDDIVALGDHAVLECRFHKLTLSTMDWCI